MYVIKGLSCKMYYGGTSDYAWNNWVDDPKDAKKFSTISTAATFISEETGRLIGAGCAHSSLGSITIGKLVEKTAYEFEEVK